VHVVAARCVRCRFASSIHRDSTNWSKVIAVNAEDLTASVEAGVARKQLNAEISHTGMADAQSDTAKPPKQKSPFGNSPKGLA
jgi:hypothetical protein